jgi:predicted RNase H-related nuclease YkuK (DUF458 family)
MNFAGMIYTGIRHWHIIRLSCHFKTFGTMGGITISSSLRQQKPKPYEFHNSMYSHLDFDEVFSKLVAFIRQAPYYHYRLSIGSDSHVEARHTVFVTAIHLHRVGRGAIGFITKQIINRAIHSLREKIYHETARTLEIASLFTPEKIDLMIDALLQYSSRPGDICFEFHLDVGTSGATKDLIGEMVAMAKGTIFTPKIKPDSYAACAYADRYTKISLP